MLDIRSVLMETKYPVYDFFREIKKLWMVHAI